MKPGMLVFVAVVLIACLVVGNVGAYEAYYTFDVDLNNLYFYDASGEKSFYGDRYSLYNATRYQISVDVSMTGNKLGTGMIILNENGLASSSGDGFMVGDLSIVTNPAKISVLADGIQAAYEDSPYSCNITVIHDPSFSPQKTRFYHNGILVSGTSETWASNAFYLCNIVYDDFEPVTSVSIGTVHVWADGSDYMLADIIALPTSGYAPLIVNFQDQSVGFLAFDSYNLDFDDGYYSAGYWEPDIAFSHTPNRSTMPRSAHVISYRAFSRKLLRRYLVHFR